jgi:hypothetical protein
MFRDGIHLNCSFISLLLLTALLEVFSLCFPVVVCLGVDFRRCNQERDVDWLVSLALLCESLIWDAGEGRSYWGVAC